MTSDLISVAEAARIIGVERQVVYRYIKAGKLPATRVAGHILVSRADAEAVTPGKKGWAPKHIPDTREWTRAMTLKRLDEWNDAVRGGAFDDPESGKVDAGLVAAWEQEHGWTRADLLAAAERHLENRVAG
jgi:excisionase family DNA binding protein